MMPNCMEQYAPCWLCLAQFVPDPQGTATTSPIFFRGFDDFFKSLRRGRHWNIMALPCIARVLGCVARIMQAACPLQ